jgi:hypothetical protein
MGDIKIDLKETRCEGVDWTRVTKFWVQWRDLVNTVMKFQVLYEADNFLAS